MHHHPWNPFDMSPPRQRGGRVPGRDPGPHGRGGHDDDGRGGGHRGGPFDPRSFMGGALGAFNLFRRGGPRARRGDIRSGILALLAEQPRNGYQIMQELEQRSRGMWRPSPGAVYPALQQLEDEGLVTVETSGNGKVFSLTARGRAEAAAHASERGAPWDAVSDAAGDDVPQMFLLVKQVGAAALQVVQAGSPTQITEARRVLAETRRALYRLLAEDGEDGGEADDDKSSR
ncbi:MAG TPA: PadR family transcriptional regulator [Polyangia bacterium]|nr:PadR family transcriptional regulator [Polyangia bacterium]